MKKKELTMTETMFNQLKEEKKITGESVNTLIRWFIREGLAKSKKERVKG